MTALQFGLFLAVVVVGGVALVRTAIAVGHWSPRFVEPAGWLSLALATWCGLKSDIPGLLVGAVLAAAFGVLTIRDGQADARLCAGREWM